jgi:hypothetical protein
VFLLEEPTAVGFAVCVGQTCLAAAGTADEAVARL